MPVLRRLAGPYARAVCEWARDLLNPPAAWPSNVRYQVCRLARLNLRNADLVWSRADARTAQRLLNLNGRINDLPYGHLATTVRARLDLPRVSRRGHR